MSIVGAALSELVCMVEANSVGTTKGDGGFMLSPKPSESLAAD